MQIFSRLAIHADNRRECDGTLLAKLYQTVQLLATNDDWQAPKAMTIGKLEDLAGLIVGPGDRRDSTEVYTVYKELVAEAQAIFAWACAKGLKRPSREDIKSRVLELTDPKKFAEKQAEKASKEAAKAEGAQEDAATADDEPEEEAEAPQNLIATEARPTMPNWKDVPDGMVALYKEGCKQSPGHQFDMMRDFAKQFVWTAAMVKGLIAGIAESQDGESAEESMQTLVDAIAEEYSIFPSSELAEEEVAEAA